MASVSLNLYRSDLTQYAEEIAAAIEREECAGEEVRNYFTGCRKNWRDVPP